MDLLTGSPLKEACTYQQVAADVRGNGSCLLSVRSLWDVCTRRSQDLEANLQQEAKSLLDVVDARPGISNSGASTKTFHWACTHLMIDVRSKLPHDFRFSFIQWYLQLLNHVKVHLTGKQFPDGSI